MTGLYLLFVVILWAVIVIWLSKTITSKLIKSRWRFFVAFVVFAVLLPLPLVDEIVGSRQFEQLCKENSTIQVDREKMKGRTVYLAEPPYVEIKGTWVRIVMRPWRYIDVITGETVVSFNMLMASGGRFIRALGISEGGVPLMFKGDCEKNLLFDKENLFKEIGVTQIDRRDLQKFTVGSQRERTK